MYVCMYVDDIHTYVCILLYKIIEFVFSKNGFNTKTSKDLGHILES